jgi:signal transduction histidine kinase
MERQTDVRLRAALSLDQWRRQLLRVLLPAGGAALTFGWLATFLAGSVSLSREFAYVVVFAPIIALGYRFIDERPRLFSWAFVTLLFVPVAHAILLAGWTPGLVVLLIFLSTIAGLLVGKAAAYLILLGTAALFATAGILAEMGHAVNASDLTSNVKDALRSSSFSNWVRTSVVFGCYTGAAGWGLHTLLRLLTNSASAHADSIARLREQHALLSTIRLERSTKTEQLQDAQRFQLVTQLGYGLERLFGATLSTMRRSVKELEGAQLAERYVLAKGIVDSAMAAAARSHGVLAFLRPYVPTRAPLQLGLAVGSVAAKFRVRLRSEVSLDLDTLFDDEVSVTDAWLEQVLFNLLFNAEEAIAAQGGTITVQTRRLAISTPYLCSGGTLDAGVYAVVRVLDNGGGMTPEVAAHAFEPFYSNWGPVADSHLGIGLTTVLEMVRKAGGTVEIDARPSSGASVAVYIPVATTPAKAHSVIPIATPPFVPTWREPILRRLALAMLAAAGLGMLALTVHGGWTKQGWSEYLGLAIAIVAAAAFSGLSRSAYPIRLTVLLVGSFAVSLTLVARTGFSAPYGIALLSITVLITWILGSRNVGLASLVAAIAAILMIGASHASGALSSAADTVGGSSAWYEEALALPGLLLLGVTSVLHVVQTAQSAVSRLEMLDLKLSSLDEQLAQEVRSVANLDQITARANHLENLGRITGAVAHDVNNSLTIVAAWATALCDDQLAWSALEIEEATTAIRSAVHHAEELLATSGIRDAYPNLKSRIDLAKETTDAERLMLALLKPGQRLVVDATSEAFVVCNSHAYRRALFNLVSNAKDAMNANGRCLVVVHTREDTVEVEVRDNGSGMDEATRLSIFSPFFTTKGHAGNGLGLFSVATLVSECNGRTSVWSAPGLGTRITLTFPKWSS